MDNFNVDRAKAALGHLMQYGTYTYAKIQELHALKRSFLAGNKLERPALLELAEYLFLSGQLSPDRAVPYEAKPDWKPPKNPQLDPLNDIVIDIKDGNSGAVGRSVGMYCGLPARSEWSFIRELPALLLKAGGNILEIGPGHSYGAIKFACNRPDKTVITIDANALNVMGAYQNLQTEGLIDKPIKNLKIMLGDIRWTSLPSQQRADLVILQSVINRSGDIAADEKILRAAVDNSLPSGKLLIIPAPGEVTRISIASITGKIFGSELGMADQRKAAVFV